MTPEQLYEYWRFLRMPGNAKPWQFATEEEKQKFQDDYDAGLYS